MRIYDDIGIQVPEILLPRGGVDLTRWSVIACDQFTSEPEYWNAVEKHVGDSPSALRLTLPEVYLGVADERQRIDRVRKTMIQYLADGLFVQRQGMVYVERTYGGRIRKGLLLAIDLERYSFEARSISLVRPTEETIAERLVKRVRIRNAAPIELPHVLLLVDDPHGSVIERIANARDELEKLYDFELMMGGGQVAGYLVPRSVESDVVGAIRNLNGTHPGGLPDVDPRRRAPLLFAVGDGNHSLASAKVHWERLKPTAAPNHPARYTLVEVENINDPAVIFHPIHRVVSGVTCDLHAALKAQYGDDVNIEAVGSLEEMVEVVNNRGGKQKVGLIGGPDKFATVEFSRTSCTLAVAAVQAFLDSLLRHGRSGAVDYVHGENVLFRLGQTPGHAGFYLPGLDKSKLFETIRKDGALPRKAFSIGEAGSKRFYVEARRID